ncbi:hypothetical protein C9F11_32735 [Streptomyces sp. YIM 121038]|nr:hypothetical protein C9F11_32735 [Streptomyces sp. YIM 121038]
MDWINPRYAAATEFLATIRADAPGRGLRRCGMCSGYRAQALVSEDGTLYAVPCAWCGTAGVRPDRRHRHA